MKLLELEEKPDNKKLYREIAKAALGGDDKEPPLAAPVQLYEGTPPSEADVAKLVSQLRSGLASVGMGRFTVELIGNRAWISVNHKPVRARKPKTAKVAAKKPDVKATGK